MTSIDIIFRYHSFSYPSWFIPGNERIITTHEHNQGFTDIYIYGTPICVHDLLRFTNRVVVAAVDCGPQIDATVYSDVNRSK